MITIEAKLDKKIIATAGSAEEAAIQQLIEWIRQDVKHPVLKELQGMIWRQGYEGGVFKAPLYEDVLPAWQAWSDAGLRLGIYSSGSVVAQKLFYKYTEQGDVLGFLEAHFDLTVGGKNHALSYRAIADQLHLPAHEILFLSDRPEELVAAGEAGLLVAHIVRPGTAQVPDFKAFASFNDL